MELLKETLTTSLSRKKFLLAGLSLTAIASYLGWKKGKNSVADKNRVRYLTQEGKLVEVDLNNLPAAKRTASKEELQGWIKR